MARSAENPHLPYVQAKAYGRGRDGKAVRYLVIHYTAGSERPTSAEDGALYDARRTDGTSTHYFADSNSVVQCVLTSDRANAARHKGNRLGIQYELCGTVQTRAQWLDAASVATLRNAAKQAALDCRRYGLPARRLSVAETRRAWTEYPAGPRGIVGHVDCTLAYPEDGGDHTDPGKAFPWDVFLGMVQEEIDKYQEVKPVATQFNADDQTVLYERAKDITDLTNWPTGGGQKSDVGQGVWNAGFPLTSGATRTPAWANFQAMYELLVDMKTQLDGIEARQIADSQVIQKLDLDPADEPPQLNPIVIGTRHAIANP